MCQANNTVGLTGLLGVLVDLLNNLRLSMDSMPDMVQAFVSPSHLFVSCGNCSVDTKEKVIPVDLSEMAEFIAVVQNRFVFLTCVSRCQLQFIGQTLSLQETTTLSGFTPLASSHALCHKESPLEDDRRTP